MNLTDLKHKSITELAQLAADQGLDGIGGMRKHELIFSILQAETDRDGEIHGEGVMEKMPDGVAVAVYWFN